jgi:AraC-like DNA-binding protein
MTETAITSPIDLRDDPAIRAGALAWASPDVVTGWHSHPYHQLEYALAGVAEVETKRGRYLLPPQQAIWIPAGTDHNTTLRGVRSVSLFFHPDDLLSASVNACVLAVEPVLREMIHYATRWPINRPGATDPTADCFFSAIGNLIIEALDDRLPFYLPAASDPVVAAVIKRTTSDLTRANLVSICAACGVSERTLRRRIQADIGMTWTAYLTQARLLRAVAMLTSNDRSVLDIATTVGFDSPSGFTRAFRKLTGTTPATYRTQHVSLNKTAGS